jgi:hypothetical protein
VTSCLGTGNSLTFFYSVAECLIDPFLPKRGGDVQHGLVGPRGGAAAGQAGRWWALVPPARFYCSQVHILRVPGTSISLLLLPGTYIEGPWYIQLAFTAPRYIY